MAIPIPPTAGINAGTALQRKCEHPGFSRSALAEYTKLYSDEPYALERLHGNLADLKAKLKRDPMSPGTPLALPPAVAEVFGSRLASAAGLRAAPVTLTMDMPSEESYRSAHVKRLPGGAWCLSKRIPEAIPVYFLKGKCETLPPGALMEPSFRAVFVSLFDKRCPLERGTYADFPDSPPQAALDAARWSSDARVLQYVYRYFLFCTYPHTSNALVDTSGRLWLIDFEKTYLAEERDIELLHSMVSGCPRVMELCQQVGRITPADIERAFEGIPERFWGRRSSMRRKFGVFNTPQRAGDYFNERLARWQRYFNQQGRAMHAGQ